MPCRPKISYAAAGAIRLRRQARDGVCGFQQDVEGVPCHAVDIGDRNAEALVDFGVFLVARGRVAHAPGELPERVVEGLDGHAVGLGRAAQQLQLLDRDAKLLPGLHKGRTELRLVADQGAEDAAAADGQQGVSGKRTGRPRRR